MMNGSPEPAGLSGKSLSPRVFVVMPAYNAARTLKRTFDELPHDLIDTVILVDDASRDATVDIARHLGLKVFVHNRNYGYGANQKTCYREALGAGADVVVMVHPDYQYDPTLVPDIIAPILRGGADVVLGSRLLGEHPVRQGMPWWKYIANRALTWLENVDVQAAPLRVSHRVPRIQPPCVGDRELRDERRRVCLRSGNHRAVRQQRPARDGSACPNPVLPGGIVGVVPAKLVLRPGDSAGIGQFVLHRSGLVKQRRFDSLSRRYGSQRAGLEAGVDAPDHVS